MGNITIHNNIILLNDGDAANLIIIRVLLILHLLLSSVVLLSLNDVAA